MPCDGSASSDSTHSIWSARTEVKKTGMRRPENRRPKSPVGRRATQWDAIRMTSTYFIDCIFLICCMYSVTVQYSDRKTHKHNPTTNKIVTIFDFEIANIYPNVNVSAVKWKQKFSGGYRGRYKRNFEKWKRWKIGLLNPITIVIERCQRVWIMQNVRWGIRLLM
jgi:hypothetical protein